MTMQPRSLARRLCSSICKGLPYSKQPRLEANTMLACALAPCPMQQALRRPQLFQCWHPAWHDSLNLRLNALSAAKGTNPTPVLDVAELQFLPHDKAACRHPTWHDSLNLGCPANMTTMLVDELESYGFEGALGSDEWNAQPVFLESFEVGNLKSASSITDIPLIQLLDEATAKVPDLTTTYSR